MKNQNNTDKSGLEKKIDDARLKRPDTCGLFRKTDYNAKINETEDKIPTVTRLPTTAAFNDVENKISRFSDLVKKTDYYAKITDSDTKYFIVSRYNIFTGEILNAKLKKTDKLIINMIFLGL